MQEDWSEAFDKAYAKRAYVHWYERTGMEMQDILDAREEMAATVHDWDWEGMDPYGAEEAEEMGEEY